VIESSQPSVPTTRASSAAREARALPESETISLIRIIGDDLPRRETPGSAGVSPARRKPKTGTRRRDAIAPGNCAPVPVGADVRRLIIQKKVQVKLQADSKTSPVMTRRHYAGWRLVS
jgi:hypothetical protein